MQFPFLQPEKCFGSVACLFPVFPRISKHLAIVKAVVSLVNWSCQL